MVAEQEKKQTAIPDFRPGDTVRISIKVVEGDSERIQIFEGAVISRRGHGEAQSFTVRKISFGVGVERTFPLFSPHIDKIEVVKSGRVRRARLYYLRNLSGKAARLNEQEVVKTDGAKPQAGVAPEVKASEAQPEAKSEAKPAKAEKKAAKSAEAPAKAEPGAKAVGAASAKA